MYVNFVCLHASIYLWYSEFYLLCSKRLWDVYCILSVFFFFCRSFFVCLWLIMVEKGWDTLLEAMKKARRLNNHVFSMLKARCPLEDKTACAIKQSGAPLHRIKFENTVSAFETLPQKGIWIWHFHVNTPINSYLLFCVIVFSYFYPLFVAGSLIT